MFYKTLICNVYVKLFVLYIFFMTKIKKYHCFIYKKKCLYDGEDLNEM